MFWEAKGNLKVLIREAIPNLNRDNNHLIIRSQHTILSSFSKMPLQVRDREDKNLKSLCRLRRRLGVLQLLSNHQEGQDRASLCPLYFRRGTQMMYNLGLMVVEQRAFLISQKNSKYPILENWMIQECLWILDLMRVRMLVVLLINHSSISIHQVNKNLPNIMSILSNFRVNNNTLRPPDSVLGSLRFDNQSSLTERNSCQATY